MSRVAQSVSVLVVAVVVGACTGEPPLVEVKGNCADAFRAEVCTWATTKGADLVEAGAMVPLASIENAPADQPMVWPPVAAATIDLPAAAQAQGGLTQLTMYWEAGGHPPVPFLTPHFDFHFNTVGAADRAAMDCKDATKPAALPASYALPDIPLPPEMQKVMGVPALISLCVPQMGMHALLASEIERKDAFNGTMVIGYWKGKPIFIEPMVTQAMLMKKESFDLPIPDIPGMTGAHPTKFRAEYDAKKQAYKFTLSAFTKAA